MAQEISDDITWTRMTSIVSSYTICVRRLVSDACSILTHTLLPASHGRETLREAVHVQNFLLESVQRTLQRL